jgi:5-formyltetrahydrofolate cyclo-ligase
MMDRTLSPKQALRRRIAAARDALAPAEIEAKSRAIVERLFALEAFERAATVALFVSFRSEVRTEPLIAQALEAGKGVCVPRVCPGRRLQFRLVSDLERDLEPGRWGIREPCERTCEVAPERVEAIVVPGVAFDTRGYRIGYGGGYYDAALRRFKRAQRIGLAFECQIVERVPEAPHDLPVQWIVTESRIIECRGD